jgi:hypothetical protein
VGIDVFSFQPDFCEIEVAGLNNRMDISTQLPVFTKIFLEAFIVLSSGFGKIFRA